MGERGNFVRPPIQQNMTPFRMQHFQDRNRCKHGSCRLREWNVNV